MKIKLTVPLPESISLNKLLKNCWQANKQVKDKICADFFILLCEQLGCGFEQVEKVKVKYTLVSPNWQDLDNAEYGVLKIFNDCIVRSGLVKNDRPSHLVYERPTVEYGKERFVEVELEVINDQKNVSTTT